MSGFVSAPILHASHPSCRRGQGTTQSTGSHMSRTILVVDDDRPIAEVLADLLCDEGYDVRTAYDGQAALREIERQPVDLILSDVSMPKLDGPSLVRRLRERGDSTPVI